MAVLRQVRALIEKNLLILLIRQGLVTFIRALALPIICIVIVSYLRFLFLPPSTYGFGKPLPIRNITQDLFSTTGTRRNVVLVNNNQQDEAMSQVVDRLFTIFTEANADVHRAASEADLPSLCPSSLRGISRCYGAIILQDSPSASTNSTWAYTAISDYSLGLSTYIDRDNNDPQLYALPLIQAVDRAIAEVSGLSYPSDMLQLPFTDQTNAFYQDQIHTRFMSALKGSLAVICFIAFCGITFHLPGHIASERELGMSHLIDIMMPTHRKFHPEFVRICSTMVSFVAIYLPGFIAAGAILGTVVFTHTSTGILILYHILLCISLATFAHFLGSLFKYARLSGISIVIFSSVLAIIAQWAVPSIPIVVTVLTLLLPPVNFISFVQFTSTWELSLLGAQLTGSPLSWNLPMAGYMYFVGCVVSIVLYTTLAVFAEHTLHGISRHRSTGKTQSKISGPALVLENVHKSYSLRRQKVSVLKGLTMSVPHGQIVSLLGVNGSGKSTTLRSICGLEKISSGVISFADDSAIGLCPQRNVLWDDLTVKQHVRIFEKLKTRSKPQARTVEDLVHDCDLQTKLNARSAALSGGQKRKLQLAMAFTGGSQFCCIDEASSGMDPVSRRKIWNILLAARGSRTILFTTHALDEADALSDHIFILARGKIALSGSGPQLTERHGGGYSIRVQGLHEGQLLALSHSAQQVSSSVVDGGIFNVESSGHAAAFLKELESKGIFTYDVEGPTIEKVFLDHSIDATSGFTQSTFAESALERNLVSSHEAAAGHAIEMATFSRPTNDEEVLLEHRHTPLPWLGQVLLLMSKRLNVLPHTIIPLLFAMAIPIIIVGPLTMTFMAGYLLPDCHSDTSFGSFGALDASNFVTYGDLEVPLGPRDMISQQSIRSMLGPFTEYADSLLHEVDSFNAFDIYLQEKFKSIQLGGLYVGDNATARPIMAYKLNDGLQHAALSKALFDSYMMNTTINLQVTSFGLGEGINVGNSFQMIVYFGLAMIASTALLTLYPSFERQNQILALQLSNGISAGAIWTAHICFDAVVTIVVAPVTTAIIASLTDSWDSLTYLGLVLLFYGLASTLYAYMCTKITRSSLGAFAVAAGSQALVFLLYFLGYFVITSNALDLIHGLNVLQYTLGLVAPSASLMRTLLLGLNASRILCRDDTLVKSPADITAYGSPLLYLLLQAALYLTVLMVHDSGLLRGRLEIAQVLTRFRDVNDDIEVKAQKVPDDVQNEVKRAEQATDDNLRVLHIDKTFGKSKVVHDLTFGIQDAECFALLGPNGAGKTTTINMIRGNTKLHNDEHVDGQEERSDIIVTGHSMRTHHEEAVAPQSICPQFDAIDYLTVKQHLRFYGRAAGIPRRSLTDVVERVLASLGITHFGNRKAATLSGGNKRKLSLGIAMISQPRVLILDEPSSGMDPVSKRMMWKSLTQLRQSHFGKNTSILMTSHSMEEVSALADRIGIMRKSMLAIGEKVELCRRSQDRYHVHLELSHGGRDEKASLTAWLTSAMPETKVELTSADDQLRFSIPKAWRDTANTSEVQEHSQPVLVLFEMMEANRSERGIVSYTVFQTALEDVFLNVVGFDE